MSHNEIPILFATETGNAEACAKILAQELIEIGYPSAPVDMEEFSLSQLAQQSIVFIVASTTGEGEAPNNAAGLLYDLQTSDIHLPDLFFGVCGLGDRIYEQFAQCGKDFDAALERSGAQRVIPRMDCDEDYEDDFAMFVQLAQEWLLRD